MNFGLIGDGYAAQRHRKAIDHVKGNLVWICDPVYHEKIDREWYKEIPQSSVLYEADFIIIATPNYLHYSQVRYLLDACDSDIICEKPLCLPWEPIIDDDRINVCLQLRYIENLPEKADLIDVVMVRNQAFFNSWKGDPKLSGGNFYEFFIHYIDLAILLNADFEGAVLPIGEQKRRIVINPVQHYEDGKTNDIIDIMKIDMQDLYNKMYVDIIKGGGIKPRDIFYLKYILDRNSDKHGFRSSGIANKIHIPKDHLC